jgi:hypothetical protein
MTDFDYGLANNAIRITSDRSDWVCLWFWPQMSGITDRMIAAAKQDMWEAKREPRGQVFCGERQGKQCDLSIDQLRAWKGLVRVRFEYTEIAAAILTWAKENGIVLVDDREKLPIASRVYSKAARDRQDREASTVYRREAAVPPLPVVPLARRVPASPPRQPKPATDSTLLPKMPLPPHLQRKG